VDGREYHQKQAIESQGEISIDVDFDSISMDQLSAAGGVKWAKFPGKIGAFVAEMDFGTAPVVTKAMHEAIDLGRLGYLPQKLADDMADATATWQRESYGWHVPASWVQHTSDVLNGLQIAIEHYSKPGTPVIVPTPAYMPFFRIPGELGRDVIEVPLIEVDGRYTFDLEGLDRAFKQGGSLLVLCNPYNPVGRVFDKQELLDISEVVARNNGRVFADEIHAPLVFRGATHVPYASISAETALHTVTATSASKAWNVPGLKCAQLIFSNGNDMDIWERQAQKSRHGASNLGVIASIAAYRDGRPWLEKVLNYIDGNRRLLDRLIREHLPKIRYTQPEGTYIGWLDARALGLECPADFFAREADVAMTDGATCGKSGAGFMRFVFATPRPVLESAIEQMAAAIARQEKPRIPATAVGSNLATPEDQHD